METNSICLKRYRQVLQELGPRDEALQVLTEQLLESKSKLAKVQQEHEGEAERVREQLEKAAAEKLRLEEQLRAAAQREKAQKTTSGQDAKRCALLEEEIVRLRERATEAVRMSQEAKELSSSTSSASDSSSSGQWFIERAKLQEQVHELKAKLAACATPPLRQMQEIADENERLRTRLKTVESGAAALMQLQLKHDRLVEQSQQWRQLAGGVEGFQSPEQLSQYIANLQASLQLAKYEHEKAASLLAQYQERFQYLEMYPTEAKIIHMKDNPLALARLAAVAVAAAAANNLDSSSSSSPSSSSSSYSSSSSSSSSSTISFSQQKVQDMVMALKELRQKHQRDASNRSKVMSILRLFVMKVLGWQIKLVVEPEHIDVDMRWSLKPQDQLKLRFSRDMTELHVLETPFRQRKLPAHQIASMDWVRWFSRLVKSDYRQDSAALQSAQFEMPETPADRGGSEIGHLPPDCKEACSILSNQIEAERATELARVEIHRTRVDYFRKICIRLFGWQPKLLSSKRVELMWHKSRALEEALKIQPLSLQFSFDSSLKSIVLEKMYGDDHSDGALKEFQTQQLLDPAFSSSNSDSSSSSSSSSPSLKTVVEAGFPLLLSYLTEANAKKRVRLGS